MFIKKFSRTSWLNVSEYVLLVFFSSIGTFLCYVWFYNGLSLVMIDTYQGNAKP